MSYLQTISSITKYWCYYNISSHYTTIHYTINSYIIIFKEERPYHCCNSVPVQGTSDSWKSIFPGVKHQYSVSVDIVEKIMVCCIFLHGNYNKVQFPWLH